MTAELLLPDASDAGLVRRWYLPVDEQGSSREDPEHYITYARFLGLGTSHTNVHRPHDGAYVARGDRCNACRWFEARIFRELELPPGVDDVVDVTDPADVRLGQYVVHYVGGTIVPGEVPLCRYEVTPSAFMVIESMTTRQTTDRGPEVYLAKPAAHALASAAQFDVNLREAYINRAVS